MDRDARITVVGAGIVGASIAFHASLRHRNVTVVEAREPGRGATLASFAWINSRDKSPREYHDLNRRSLDMWPRFQRALDSDTGLRWGGEMRWSATEDGASALLDHAGQLRSWGYPVIEMSKKESAALEPGLVMEPFTAAVYCGIEGHVDTQRVVRACLNRVVKNGGNVRANSPVDRVNMEQGANGKSAVRSVTLADGAEVPCDVLVIAAGYDSTALAAMAGIEFSQRRSPGATIVTGPVSKIFRNIVCMHTPRDLPEPLMNVRQFDDGSVMVHGGNHFGSVGDTSDDDAEKLMDEIARFIPALAGTRVKQVRRGMRPMPEDGFR